MQRSSVLALRSLTAQRSVVQRLYSSRAERAKAFAIIEKQRKELEAVTLRHRATSEEHGKKIAKVEHLDPKGQTKRWFKGVDVDAFPSKSGKFTKYRVLLDDRIVLTPGSEVLWTPSEVLSYAVAAEWEMQEKTITPHMMPLMGICCTTLDHVPTKRNHAIDTILGYIVTDTLCYRGKRTTTARLYETQTKYHQPVVEWCQERFNCSINIIEEGHFSEATQPEILFQKVRWMLNELSDWELGVVIAAVYQLTENSKSFILGLALFENAVDLDWAIQASRAEENFQISQFGMVEAEHDITEADIRTRLGAAIFFGRLVRGVVC